jgi:hypothetical protein
MFRNYRVALLASVLSDAVDPVRNRLGNIRIGTVVRENLAHIALAPPLLTRIFVVPQQLLLLDVHQDVRRCPVQELHRLVIDVVKPRIPVRMILLALRFACKVARSSSASKSAASEPRTCQASECPPNSRKSRQPYLAQQ